MLRAVDMGHTDMAISISLICLTIHAAVTWDAMPLNIIIRTTDHWRAKVNNRWFTLILNFIEKPLYNCLPCMGSIYSILYALWSEMPLNWVLLELILVVVGINAILALFIRLIEAVEDLG
jgi:hypothetical protein